MREKAEPLLYSVVVFDLLSSVKLHTALVVTFSREESLRNLGQIEF
jgi:hypothetical protein